LGSAWEADLSVLGENLFKLPGTIWLVPHQVDEARMREFEEILRKSGVSYLTSSEMRAPGSQSQAQSSAGLLSQGAVVRCVLVNEMGFLSELYSCADWAYVGGGFGKGVHNTIEPAIHGIPIACGPAKNDRFPEIGCLRKTGQLRVLRDTQEASLWLAELELRSYASQRKHWKEKALDQLGATERILDQLS
jgi:3-deoxy-D-manno-octulosonic-acid transferase